MAVQNFLQTLTHSHTQTHNTGRTEQAPGGPALVDLHRLGQTTCANRTNSEGSAAIHLARQKLTWSQTKNKKKLSTTTVIHALAFRLRLGRVQVAGAGRCKFGLGLQVDGATRRASTLVRVKLSTERLRLRALSRHRRPPGGLRCHSARLSCRCLALPSELDPATRRRFRPTLFRSRLNFFSPLSKGHCARSVNQFGILWIVRYNNCDTYFNEFGPS